MTRKVKPEKYKDIPAAIIRNRSKQQVDTVFFPNSVVIKPKLKVIGVLQTTEILNAGEVREAGVPITPASFLFTPDIMLIKADSESIADPDRNTDFIDLVTAYGFNREVEFLGYGNADSHLTKPFSYVNVLNQFTASANSGKPLYPESPKDTDGTLLGVTGSSGSISFYTETKQNRENSLNPDNFLALKLEFEKNNSEDVTYRCLFLKQYLSGTDSTEHTSGVKPLPKIDGVSVQEKLRSVNLSNPFIIKGKSQTVNINRSFTVKKLEPGDKGDSGGPGPAGAEGPIFSLSPNPQPITLNSDPGGSVTLSSSDKSTISGQVSGSQLTYVEPLNSDESVNPTSDLNFSIDFGKNNVPTADFVDLSGNVTTISESGAVYDFVNKTLTFTKDDEDRLQLTITKSANNDCEALVTIASKNISSDNHWVSCTVNLDAYVNRNGEVNPGAPGFQLPIHIVKNIPVTTTIVGLSKETINITTDYLGRHPTEKKQYDSYDNSSSDDNVPTSAFTTVTVKAGETDLTFDGHQEPGEEPSINTYRIDTKNAVMKTVGPARSDGSDGTLTEMTLDNNLRVHNVTYPGGGNPSATDPSTGDVDYHLWGNSALGGNVVFGVFIDKDSNNNAKISVSILDYTDGSKNNTSPEESSLFDSVEVSIPVVINSNGRIENEVKTFTVIKIKEPDPGVTVSLSRDTFSVPADHNASNDGGIWGPTALLAFKTVISVSQEEDSLTWDGDQNTSTNTYSSTAGRFKVGTAAATGTTDNGATFSLSLTNNFNDTPNDKDYEVRYSNNQADRGRIFDFKVAEDTNGNPEITLDFLSPFDNNTANSTINGNRQFINMTVTIPVNITKFDGAQVTENVNLQINKIKSAEPTKFLALDLNSNVVSFSNSEDNSPNPDEVIITITQTGQSNDIVSNNITADVGTIEAFQKKSGNSTGTGIYEATLDLPNGQADYPINVSVENEGLSSSKLIAKATGGDEGPKGDPGPNTVVPQTVSITATDQFGLDNLLGGQLPSDFAGKRMFMVPLKFANDVEFSPFPPQGTLFPTCDLLNNKDFIKEKATGIAANGSFITTVISDLDRVVNTAAQLILPNQSRTGASVFWVPLGQDGIKINSIVGSIKGLHGVITSFDDNPGDNIQVGIEMYTNVNMPLNSNQTVQIVRQLEFLNIDGTSSTLLSGNSIDAGIDLIVHTSNAFNLPTGGQGYGFSLSFSNPTDTLPVSISPQGEELSFSLTISYQNV